MANVIYNYTQMKFKQAYCDLVIPRLGGPGTSLLIINFGKTISSKFTKTQIFVGNRNIFMEWITCVVVTNWRQWT